jgi:glutamate racemase
LDNRPIGVFDSGVGGLTAVRALQRLLPSENILYFGDSGRAPYGCRPVDEIRRIARQDSSFLAEKGVKALLVACGTMDSNALGDIVENVTVPVGGVVRPSAEAAAAATRNGRVGVLATAATARSGAFGRALAAARASLTVTAEGCPLLVPLIESGHGAADDPALGEALDEYLAPMQAAGVDTLLLGCTHFPLVSDAIAARMGPGVTLIDSGAEGARACARNLAEAGLLCGQERRGSSIYYTSGGTDAFARLSALFLDAGGAGPIRGVEPFRL